jgi:uncharacterized protein YyaL (SSP411 family)
MITSGIKYTNHLINENSPYLLQHAHNPVNWYPWGDEAFKRARTENKMVLVSVGYAACHWCHVMEHESFEDENVAAIMNEHFVCIKVDREERPDIDQVYMDAVQLLNQHGGWPLNCFTLPDGRPIYGGTYFPKKNWMEVLLSLYDVYQHDYEKVLEQGNAIAAGLADISPLIQLEQQQAFDPSFLEQYYQTLSKNFDSVCGGSKGAPKFPMPVIYEFLLRYYFHTHDKNILEEISVTLDKMAMGGIFDHLGGGFARYSTDEKWIVPHFEKMLYDNSQLISLYSKAYKLTGDPNYKNVVTESIRFIERELTSPDGAFYSSIDADSEGVEGKFYVWTKGEIDSILREKSEFFCSHYQIRENGNWEHGKNILYLKEFPTEEERPMLEECKSLLFREREKHVRPALDSKILCSWNALMIEAYLDAFAAFQVHDYYDKALTAATYLEQNHLEKGRVWRVNQNGKKIHGFLDDYAFTAKAFIRLFQVSCNEKWLGLAKSIAEQALSNFADPDTGLFFYTSAEDEPLAIRKHELHDNVTPASNSTLAHVLFQLGRYYANDVYRETALRMLDVLSGSILKYGWYHAGWARLICDIVFPSFEVAITGPDAREKVMELESQFLPHVLICGSVTESFLPLLEQRYKPGETWLYVCEDQTCELPVNKVEIVIDQVTKG